MFENAYSVLTCSILIDLLTQLVCGDIYPVACVSIEGSPFWPINREFYLHPITLGHTGKSIWHMLSILIGVLLMHNHKGFTPLVLYRILSKSDNSMA